MVIAYRVFEPDVYPGWFLTLLWRVKVSSTLQSACFWESKMRRNDVSLCVARSVNIFMVLCCRQPAGVRHRQAGHSIQCIVIQRTGYLLWLSIQHNYMLSKLNVIHNILQEKL